MLVNTWAVLALCVWSVWSVCLAETRTWTGGANDGVWHNPANWSGEAVPSPADDTVVPPGQTKVMVSRDGAVRNLRLGREVVLEVRGGAVNKWPGDIQSYKRHLKKQHDALKK